MRWRASRALVLHPQGDRLIVFNFLAKSVFSAKSLIFDVLANFRDWQDEVDWPSLFPGKSSAAVTRELGHLIDLHALIAENGREAALEEEYFAVWEWTLPCGLFHFSLRDIAYQPSSAAIATQKDRALTDPSPPLYLLNEGKAEIHALPAVRDTPLQHLVRSRRTCRDAAPRSLQPGHLAHCLFAGLGIVDEIVTETGQLPLSTTPSGGARNPFEAYIQVRSVEGLKPGFYHYSARQHSLQQLEGDLNPDPGSLLGDQGWANAMPCVIYLVAFLERTMWKYSDPNAYRVVLIEAGHIGQNIMLAATENGLSACPTAALQHSAIHRCLKLHGLTRSVLYALTLSFPDLSVSH